MSSATRNLRPTVQNNSIGLLLLSHTERNIVLREEDVAYVQRFARQAVEAHLNHANNKYTVVGEMRHHHHQREFPLTWR